MGKYILVLVLFLSPSVFAKFTDEEEGVCLNLGGKVTADGHLSACDFGNGIIVSEMDLSYHPTLDHFRCEVLANKSISPDIQNNLTTTVNPRQPYFITITGTYDRLNAIANYIDNCVDDNK